MLDGQQKQITIGIIDPLEPTEYALTTLFNSQPEMQVIVTARDGELGLRALIEHRPRVAVVEIDLESRSGFEIAGDLAMRQRETKVVLYSVAMPDIYVDQALRTKVAGYVLKTDSLSNLVAAVQRVANGGTYYSEAIRERITVDPLTGQMKTHCESRLATLSDRQIEVLRNLAVGLSVKDVAKKMHISVKSVDSHKYRIMQALEIHDRVDLARYAIREGLVCP